MIEKFSALCFFFLKRYIECQCSIAVTVCSINPHCSLFIVLLFYFALLTAEIGCLGFSPEKKLINIANWHAFSSVKLPWKPEIVITIFFPKWNKEFRLIWQICASLFYPFYFSILFQNFKETKPQCGCLVGEMQSIYQSWLWWY